RRDRRSPAPEQTVRPAATGGRRSTAEWAKPERESRRCNPVPFALPAQREARRILATRLDHLIRRGLFNPADDLAGAIALKGRPAPQRFIDERRVDAGNLDAVGAADAPDVSSDD